MKDWKISHDRLRKLLAFIIMKSFQRKTELVEALFCLLRKEVVTFLSWKDYYHKSGEVYEHYYKTYNNFYPWK